MFCKICGKEINDDAKFCSGCGTTVDTGLPVNPAGQAPPPVQQQYGQPQGQYTPPPQEQATYWQPPPQQQYDQTYGQQYGQYQQPPQKKSKKPLFGIAGAAAGVLVFFLAIFPMIGGGSNTGSKSGGMDIEVFVEPPGGRDVPFIATEGGFSTNDPNISMIEVNQGMSYGFNTDTGEFYVMENFVAGKETAIFISMLEPPDSKSEIKLTIEKDGEHIATLFPELTDDPTLLLFQPKDMSEARNWEQGVYTFTYTMDDSVAIRETNFFKSMPVKILAVPILANYSGKIIGCNGEWVNSSEMFIASYPVARDDVEYILGPELDLSDDRYDLNTTDGQYYVWRALKDLQTPNNDYTLIAGFVRDQIGNALGYTFGIPATISVESVIGVDRVVAHEAAHCWSIGDEYHGGHINNILNAPPYLMEGIDIITYEPDAGNKEHVKGGFEMGLHEVGSVVYPEQRAYWVGQRYISGAVTSFMGSYNAQPSTATWITSDIWNHLFKVFTGQLNGNAPGYVDNSGDDPGKYWGMCPSCSADIYDARMYFQCKDCLDYVHVYGNPSTCESCGSKWPLDNIPDNEIYIGCPVCWTLVWYPDLEAFNSGNVTGYESDEFSDMDARNQEVNYQGPDMITIVEITGYFDKEGTFVPDPWYTYPGPAGSVTASMPGDYSACIYDDKGTLISKSYFDVKDTSQQTTEGGTSSLPDARMYVEIMLKFPDNATKISIMKGNKEIYTRTASNNAPTVAFTGLSDYQNLSNKTTITWEASDADGDELTFELWYCTGKMKEYFLIKSELTGRSCEVDLSDYPGGERGYFYIYATDGIRTAENKSPFINKPYKAPVIITAQKDTPKIKVTEEIYFPTEIYDAQDGYLSGDSVEWFLDGDMSKSVSITRALQAWPYQLEPGIHTFTCVATNSGGLAAEKDFKFEIVNDESDLPNDWSRSHIVYALTNGYIAPVSRIDAPITRGEFADLAFMLFYYMWPDGLVYYDGDLIKDCGVDDYSEFLMATLGLMDAPDGYFDPHSSVTQGEAMKILYQVYLMSLNNTTDLNAIGFDENEAIKFFTESGVFSESGENGYNPNEKLSKKIALARSGILDDWIFDEE